MLKLFYNPRNRARIIFIILAFLFMVVLATCYYKYCFGASDSITHFFAKSENNYIEIAWIPPSLDICDRVVVQVTDSKGASTTKTFSPFRKNYKFTSGIHGELYVISLSAMKQNSLVGEQLESKVLFLDYSQLPDIPIVEINTDAGEDPTYTDSILYNEEGDVIGVSIKNNEYLPGEVKITGPGMQTITDSVKIKVRGNTSSAGNEKKAYKLKFGERQSLLPEHPDALCREWVLLNNGNELKTFIGDQVGNICDVYDQHNMIFVNVMLNGDWKGCYALTQATSYDVSSDCVSPSGYLFESDNTYWNNDGLYFRTANQQSSHGYTFKYPEITDITQPEVISIQNYMQTIENLLLNDDVSYRDYIDEESFARWILAKDILGNLDGNGSNIFYYKYDMIEDNPTSSKLIIGNTWDFDSIFQTLDEWSASRNYSFYGSLFKQSSFNDLYSMIWNELSPHICSDILESLDELDESYSKAIDESWKLEEKRWGEEIAPFSDQKEEAITWFENRTEWINRQMLQ